MERLRLHRIHAVDPQQRDLAAHRPAIARRGDVIFHVGVARAPIIAAGGEHDRARGREADHRRTRRARCDRGPGLRCEAGHVPPPSGAPARVDKGPDQRHRAGAKRSDGAPEVRQAVVAARDQARPEAEAVTPSTRGVARAEVGEPVDRGAAGVAIGHRFSLAERRQRAISQEDAAILQCCLQLGLERDLAGPQGRDRQPAEILGRTFVQPGLLHPLLAAAPVPEMEEFMGEEGGKLPGRIGVGDLVGGAVETEQHDAVGGDVATKEMMVPVRGLVDDGDDQDGRTRERAVQPAGIEIEQGARPRPEAGLERGRCIGGGKAEKGASRDRRRADQHIAARRLGPRKHAVAVAAGSDAGHEGRVGHDIRREQDEAPPGDAGEQGIDAVHFAIVGGDDERGAAERRRALDPPAAIAEAGLGGDDVRTLGRPALRGGADGERPHRRGQIVADPDAGRSRVDRDAGRRIFSNCGRRHEQPGKQNEPEFHRLAPIWGG